MARQWCVLSLGFLFASIALAQQSPAHKFRTPPAALSMPMVAPLFLDDKDFSSTITLVNDAIAEMQARVIVLDSEGVQVAFKEVKMPGHTSLPIQIHDLLTEAGSAANSGSVLLIPQPARGMPIGAQLSIASNAGAIPAYIEEEMLPQNEGRQGIYRAAALAVRGSPIIALKSLAQGSQTVTLQCFAEKTAPTKGSVQLRPQELLLVAACDPAQTGRSAVTDQMFNNQVDRGSVGVAVSTTGTPGDLITFGFSIYNDDRGPYFSSLNFTNPTEQLSSGTIFTGIPVGAADLFPRTMFQSEVAVSNFSTKPAQVSVTLAHTIAGKTSTELVQQLVLAGQSSRTVRIPAHGDPSMTNSLIVRSNLSPGDVVSQFIAWGDIGVRTVEMQAKDNDSVQNGGGHPWSIAQGTNSTLLLFNHSTDGPKKFEVLVGNGKQLWVGSYQLASMETKAVKINEIVEMQIPDAKGTVLSKDILSGQVGWWTHHKTWGKGRLMVSQQQAGMARSFSCGTCATLCEDAFLYPDDQASFPIGGEDDLGDVSLQQCLASCEQCGGTPQGPGTGFITWSSSNTSIATLSSGKHATMAYFTGMSPGLASGDFQATDDGCTVQGSGPITVFQFVVSGNPFIFVGTDPNIISGNSYFASNGSGGGPQPSGGTLSATSSDSKDSFQYTQGNSPVARVTTPDQSTAKLDRTLNFTYALSSGDKTSQQTMVTARQFAYVTNNTPYNACTLGYGTDQTYTYTIYTEPDKTAVDGNSGVDGTTVSETFDQTPKCLTHTGNGSINSNGQFTDRVTYCGNNPLTCSETRTQTIRVLNNTTSGPTVRTNTLQAGSGGVTYTSNGPTQ